MTVPPIRWLHLSDFHVGMDGYAQRKLFDYIINHVKQKKEQGFVPDFVFITGDLADKGRLEEYKQFWEEFARPLQAAIGGDIATRMFVIPGNHDVNRKKNEAFDRDEIARKEWYFHANADGLEARDILNPRFEAFKNADETVDKGRIFSEEGNFGRVVPLHGYQIGIAGINTAWLCKDDHDKEKLTPGKPLVEEALKKIKSADLRIVLGHHPLDWLLPGQQSIFNSLLGKPGVLYLHGHLHKQWLQPTHGGGNHFLAIQTGAAFQAEEHDVWRNGLLWGEADLEAHELRLQPYEWAKDHQEWTLKGDAFHPSFKKGEWWAYPLPGQPASPPTPPDTQPTQAVLAPITLIPTRPLLKMLPPDSWVDIGQRFIGREGSLSDVADAVTGLQLRAGGAVQPAGGQAVKLVWVHGFGGMGKSWFLHRARQQAEAISIVRTLIVEWDSPEWRDPLKGEPLIAEDLFDVLAYRLAQVMGQAFAESYWQADEQVAAASPERERLRNMFGDELRAAYEGKDAEISEETRRLLRNENLWDVDLARRQQNIMNWWNHSIRYELGFAAWCRAGSHSSDAAVIEPSNVRADALRTALQLAATQHPLLLLFDTCEVLNEELDTWLRRLLVPLLRDETPLLVFVGSRKQPDVDQLSGSRDGWRSELTERRRREIDFAEAKRFTVEEIEAALVSLHTPLVGDCTGIAERLHRLTLGVPLAVRTLLDLHEDGDELLPSLTDEDEEDLDSLGDGQAVQRVIETMVERLLKHLILRPRSVDDLRDIVALGLLQRADPDVLQAFWQANASGVRTRLRQLGNHYALLSGNELHATVRDYLRRHWRLEENRPIIFDKVLSELKVAASGLPRPAASVNNSEAIIYDLLQVNLRAWQEPAAAVLPTLAQLLAIALAYDINTEAIVALLRELPLVGPVHRLWRSPNLPSKSQIVEWLQSLVTADWPITTQASLAIVNALALPKEWQILDSEKVLAAFQSLEDVITRTKPDELPQASVIGQAYFRIARSLQAKNGRTNWPDKVERSYKQAIKYNISLPTAHNNLGYLYSKQNGRTKEAKFHFLEALKLAPKHAPAHDGLGLIYERLGNKQKAIEHYRQAINGDQDFWNAHYHLGTSLAEQVGREVEASQHLRKALKLSTNTVSNQKMEKLLTRLLIRIDGRDKKKR
ncbi:tetratricopeptide repeat protein [Hymenobacter sp. HMF4947]|uniref:Tetratricopeptide repeat protein n=1 Tax=Hymenobacter ginkgonis TaxID=2682976 RepID=A0A7K1TLK2_9BACT|nr:metallophosphoesterase [Hymenobacter ginkgonis]MVN79297.1 tetratricopeptide repeat protein [Hymenobacter ginkgonis]